MMEDCMSGSEEDNCFFDREESLDGLENDDSDSKFVQYKAPSCKVY